MIFHILKYDIQNRLFHCLLICLLLIIVYIPSFSGDFILDDIPLVKNNEYFSEFHSFGSYLNQEDGYDKYSAGHTGYYRPLVNLFYSLDYKVWGLLAPGFRITNLVLHLATCFALFAFFNLFIHNKNITLMLVVLFALHPVNTETVSWVVARNNIIATLFGLLSITNYIHAYNNKSYYDYILSSLFFTLAIFSKEFSLMLLPVFFIYHRLFLNRCKANNYELIGYLPFVIISVVYFWLRFNVTETLLTPSEQSDLMTSLINIPYIIFLNLKMVILPYNLHSFIVNYPKGMINTHSILSILGLLVGFYLLYRYRKNHLIVFSAGAFLLTLFPVIGIIKSSAPSLIAMRWLYFPLPFILLILYPLIEKLYARNRTMVACLFLAVIIFLGFNSYTLNRYLWHSEDAFFRQEVLQFDNYFYADGLADIYIREKKSAEAMVLFEKNFESGVKRVINYLAYADLLLENGETEKSLEYLEKARPLCFSPEDQGAYYDKKGVALFRLKIFEDAQQSIRMAISNSPEDPMYWEHLGVVQGKMGEHDKALETFKKAIRLGNNSTTIYINMANAYISTNECEEAIKFISRINRTKKDAGLNMLLEKAGRCLADNNT